ncbi:MAG TPA: hypothetical protein VMT85_23155 [Thermoanaerobaculia bacterium]|nr:hypothetical protein [Thermoanaerobaculia bacterium]
MRALPGNAGGGIAVVTALLALPVALPVAPVAGGVQETTAGETTAEPTPAPSDATDVTRSEIEAVLAILGDSIDQQV